MKKNLYKSLLSIALSAIGMLGLPNKASAQATDAADYYFTAKTGTYTAISSGTSVSSVEVDDGVSSSISLGFTFTYCGTDYTNVYLSSNGWITFGSSPYTYAYPGSTSYLATGSSSGIGPAVMPLWDDLSGAIGDATYKTTGSAPNRVFTAEFNDWLWDYSTSTAAISFQVKLYESTNVIQFIYKQESGSVYLDYSSGATIGLSGGSSSDYLSLNNTSSSPTASSSTFTNTLTTKPATNQIYEFSPYPACSGTPTGYAPLGPTTKVCSGVDFDIAENATFALSRTFQWQSSPAGAGTFTNIAGATNRTYTANITSNTDFRLITTCTVSGASSTSAATSIKVLETPSISASGPTTYCSNQKFVMSTASDTTYNYQWLNASTGAAISGATNNEFTPTASGSYTVKVTTGGCSVGAVSDDTLDITIKPAPDASISPDGSTTLCTGDDIDLVGSGTGDYTWHKEGTAIPSATGGTYNVTLAGAYTLVITNPSNGCTDTSDITTIIVSPPPTVNISPLDSTNVCTGLSSTLTGSTTGLGLSYQWFNSMGSISGETSSTFSTPDPEDYFLVVYAGSCTDTSGITKVRLWDLPTAVISSVGTTSAICPTGSDFVMQGTLTAGYSYQWFYEGFAIGGATSSNYTTTTPGNYSVRITDANGCIKTSDAFTASATLSSTPKVSPEDVVICEGKTIVLYANYDKYYVSYQWFQNGSALTGDTTSNITTGSTGLYSVEVRDSFNCVTKSKQISLSITPLPTKPTIIESGSILSTTTYATYQWYRNHKPISGANSKSYYFTFDGIYQVEVSNAQGCINMSDEYVINNDLGIAGKEHTSPQVTLYPNPAHDIINIECNTSVNIEVMNIHGQKVWSGKSVQSVNIKDWADGIYFFQINDQEGNLISKQKIVKY